ncbi:MAG: hypothetical protein ACYCYO_14950 [Bacilli bacterium]
MTGQDPVAARYFRVWVEWAWQKYGEINEARARHGNWMSEVVHEGTGA